jgi:hypothetical protein
MVASILLSPHSARKINPATSTRLAKGRLLLLPTRPLLVASFTASSASASSSSLLLTPDTWASLAACEQQQQQSAGC